MAQEALQQPAIFFMDQDQRTPSTHMFAAHFVDIWL